MRASEQGVGLAEIMFSAVLVFLAIFGAIALVNIDRDDGRTQKALTQRNIMAASIKRHYDGNYRRLSAIRMIEDGAVPVDMLQGIQIVNPYGGLILASGGRICGGSDRDFCLTFEDIKKSGCAALVVGEIFDAVRIGSKSFVSAPISSERAKELCENGSLFRITWRYTHPALPEE
ncbi:MAG: type 4 pilus major pilin [Pseudomonadota bacterium]|nr:type 4 pilus major pilin [Pseudomonadota bacterium]